MTKHWLPDDVDPFSVPGFSRLESPVLAHGVSARIAAITAEPTRADGLWRQIERLKGGLKARGAFERRIRGLGEAAAKPLGDRANSAAQQNCGRMAEAAEALGPAGVAEAVARRGRQLARDSETITAAHAARNWLLLYEHHGATIRGMEEAVEAPDLADRLEEQKQIEYALRAMRLPEEGASMRHRAHAALEGAGRPEGAAERRLMQVSFPLYGGQPADPAGALLLRTGPSVELAALTPVTSDGRRWLEQLLGEVRTRERWWERQVETAPAPPEPEAAIEEAPAAEEPAPWRPEPVAEPREPAWTPPEPVREAAAVDQEPMPARAALHTGGSGPAAPEPAWTAPAPVPEQGPPRLRVVGDGAPEQGPEAAPPTPAAATRRDAAQPPPEIAGVATSELLRTRVARAIDHLHKQVLKLDGAGRAALPARRGAWTWHGIMGMLGGPVPRSAGAVDEGLAERVWEGGPAELAAFVADCSWNGTVDAARPLHEQCEQAAQAIAHANEITVAYGQTVRCGQTAQEVLKVAQMRGTRIDDRHTKILNRLSVFAVAGVGWEEASPSPLEMGEALGRAFGQLEPKFRDALCQSLDAKVRTGDPEGGRDTVMPRKHDEFIPDLGARGQARWCAVASTTLLAMANEMASRYGKAQELASAARPETLH